LAKLWRIFLDEAYARFCERPEYYHEDFMFMGGIAFAYYFPVIEKYVRNAPDTDSLGGERETWILVRCIQNQFTDDTFPHVRHLADRGAQRGRVRLLIGPVPVMCLHEGFLPRQGFLDLRRAFLAVGKDTA
jgi:hypothetical protein